MSNLHEHEQNSPPKKAEFELVQLNLVHSVLNSLQSSLYSHHQVKKSYSSITPGFTLIAYLRKFFFIRMKLAGYDVHVAHHIKHQTPTQTYYSDKVYLFFSIKVI